MLLGYFGVFYQVAIILEDMHKLDLQVGHEDQKTEYLKDEYSVIREYLGLASRDISGITLERANGTKKPRK